MGGSIGSGLVITGGAGPAPLSDAQANALPGPALDPTSGYTRHVIQRVFPGGLTEIHAWIASRIQSNVLYRTDSVLVQAVPWDAAGPGWFQVVYDEGVFPGTAPPPVSNLVIRQVPTFGPGGTVKQTTQVTYNIGEHSFTDTHPPDTFTAAASIAGVKQNQNTVAEINKATVTPQPFVPPVAAPPPPPPIVAPSVPPPVVLPLPTPVRTVVSPATTSVVQTGYDASTIQGFLQAQGYGVLRVIDLGMASDPAVAASLGVDPAPAGDTRHWFEAFFE